MKTNHFYSYFYALKQIKKLDSKLEKDGWAIKNTLNISDCGLYFFPIIKKVSNSFYCTYNQLTTLQGAPKEINGNFLCYYNLIKDYSELDKIKIGGKIIK